MAKNIDDINSDDEISQGLSNALGRMRMEAFKSAENYGKMAETAEKILAGMDKDMNTWIASAEIRNKTVKMLEDRIKSGRGIESLEKNETDMLKTRLDIINGLNISTKKKAKLEEKAISLAAEEVKQRERENAARKKWLGEREKIQAVLGSGRIGQFYGEWADKNEGKIVSKMAGGGELGMIQSSLAKIGGVLLKLAPVFLLIGGAITLIFNRFKAILTSDLNYSSMISSSLGITGRAADMLKSGGFIEGAARQLQTAPGVKGQLDVAREKAIEASAAIATQFGKTSFLTQRSVEFVSMLGIRLGVSADEAARMADQLSNLPGLGVEGTIQLTKNLQLFSETAGVSFNQVIKDAADNAEMLYLYTDGSAKSIARAVVNARVLGTTLASQARTAEKFQTFEGAANAAVTLQLLTGKRLNPLQLFTQATYGSPEQLQQQMLRTILPTFLKERNVYRKRALAESIGMTPEEIMKSLKSQEEERKLIAGIRGEGYSGNITDFVKAAYRGGARGTGIGTKAEELQKQRALLEAGMSSVASVLDIASLTTPTERMEAAIIMKLDRLIEVIAGPIAKAVIWIANTFGAKISDPEEEAKRVEAIGNANRAVRNIMGKKSGDYMVPEEFTNAYRSLIEKGLVVTQQSLKREALVQAGVATGQLSSEQQLDRALQSRNIVIQLVVDGKKFAETTAEMAKAH